MNYRHGRNVEQRAIDSPEAPLTARAASVRLPVNRETVSGVDLNDNVVYRQ